MALPQVLCDRKRAVAGTALLLQARVKNCGKLRFVHFTGVVIDRLSGPIEDGDVGNVTPVVLLDELLLGGRPLQVQIDNDEVHPAAILLIKIYGAASLPLGIKSTLAVKDDVIGLALKRTVFHVVASNERAVLAVA
jgi:hypothetical protein